jgi:hypothetical protein
LAVAAMLVLARPAFAEDWLQGYPCLLFYNRVPDWSDLGTHWLEVNLYTEPHCQGSFEGTGVFWSTGASNVFGDRFSDEELLTYLERLHEASIHGAPVLLGVGGTYNGVSFCAFLGDD